MAVYVYHMVMKENNDWFENSMSILAQRLDRLGWGKEKRPQLLAWIAMATSYDDDFEDRCPCGCENDDLIIDSVDKEEDNNPTADECPWCCKPHAWDEQCNFKN